MDFEFGQTTQLDTFFDRNPKFYSAFERLMTLTNKCFGRSFKPKNRVEDLCFSLGQACRQDFLEILFLAANGYGTAASKLLRGLYERAVTVAYISKHPEKAERFVRFAAIQEYKAMNAALLVSSEEDFNTAMKPQTADSIRNNYETVKPEFQVTRCKQCGNKGTAFSWDIDMASMVREVGEPYTRYYLGAYVIPNFNIHATLASMYPDGQEDEIRKKNEHEADSTLLNAVLIFILSLMSQNSMFRLGLSDVIGKCQSDVLERFSSDATDRRESKI
jgi:hypothetical protein